MRCGLESLDAAFQEEARAGAGLSTPTLALIGKTCVHICTCTNTYTHTHTHTHTKKHTHTHTKKHTHKETHTHTHTHTHQTPLLVFLGFNNKFILKDLKGVHLLESAQTIRSAGTISKYVSTVSVNQTLGANSDPPVGSRTFLDQLS